MSDLKIFKTEGVSPNIKVVKLVESLPVIEVPCGVTCIGAAAFSHAKTDKVILPNSVKNIEYRAFYRSEIQEIVMPNVTDIEEDAFFAAKLKRVVLTEGTNRIEKRAFACCTKLTDVVLPNSLTFIGEGAFLENYSLKRIFIPKSVTTVCADAFKSCADYMEIFCEGAPQEGWVEIDEMRKVEHVVTDYSSPRNFHTSSGSFDTHRYEVEERVQISWNPDKFKVHTNVSFSQFKEICAKSGQNG